MPDRVVRTSAAPLGVALLAIVLAVPSPAQEPARPALSEDNAVAHVLDREGIAARRPVGATRWDGVETRDALLAGEWLQVGTRGANALKFHLASGAKVTCGPGTTVEVVDGATLRLSAGEIEVDPAAGKPVTVRAGASQLAVSERRVVRAIRDGLEVLQSDPRWLAGYKSDASTDAMGSLLCNVDGRNVPLSIGYHKVTVDVRDALARTIVEQSFLNHTHTVLEGVFYFPLPDDASVSSFGMWIGDELVEGEIVEKQRAREIYETILREKRDPGLLEWTGGNLFKARVYPIGAEKRIKIGYTQVLRRKGDGYAYHYALQSELLRARPLDRLELAVTVSSAETLRGVTSPTHDGRVRVTEHAASFEWSAREVTPDRDFELRIACAPTDERVRVLSHRRADEGFFLLAFDAPPAPASTAKPEPVDLIVVADTSGSMAGPARDAQVQFAEALLSALGPDDTFSLLCADVEVVAAADRPARNTPEAREQALKFLERRHPLGWTDLGKAVTAAAERTGARTHVVYIGDGIVTTGTADPSAFAARLPELHRGRGTFHCVVPGSGSEPIVLAALARCGGGSVRRLDASGPAPAAHALLREIAAPAVRDLKVRFEGVAVAAVHPEVLPNVASGTRQVVVGRYDPAAGGGTGRAIVSGTLNGKPIELAASVTLAKTDEGNSFIPRLWARHHLDHLLAQGTTPQAQARIVALSEDYQIITPSTSFLVLESDADRERFQVKKRVRMRDGEEFFQAGRDQAGFELARKQMVEAKAWRQRLRAGVLEGLVDMHREATLALEDDGGVMVGTVTAAPGGVGGAGGRWGGRRASGRLRAESKSESHGLEEMDKLGEAGPTSTPDAGADAPAEADAEAGEEGQKDAKADADHNETDNNEEYEQAKDERAKAAAPASPPAPMREQARSAAGRRQRNLGLAAGKLASGLKKKSRGYRDDDGDGGEVDVGQFDGLFPAPADAAEARPPGPARWNAEVRELLASLDRRAWLAGLPGGVRITAASESTNHRGRTLAGGAASWCLARDRWVTTGHHRTGEDYALDWCWDGRRGLCLAAAGGGRERATKAGDATAWAAVMPWLLPQATANYTEWEAVVARPEPGLVVITLRPPHGGEGVFEIVVDTERRVVREERWVVAGVVKNRTTWSDFREVAGAHFPAARTWKDEDSGTGGVTRYTVTTLEPAAFDAAAAAQLAPRAAAVLLAVELPEVAAAKQAHADGTATRDHVYVLARHFAATQQWDQALPHAERFVALAEGRRPGARLRAAAWQLARRHEPLLAWARAEIAALGATPADGDWSLALDRFNLVHSVAAPGECLDVVRALVPVAARLTQVGEAARTLASLEADFLDRLGRPEVALAARKAYAARWPEEADGHARYAQALAQQGAVEPALAHLRDVEAKGGPWLAHERQSLRRAQADLLWNTRRLDAYVRLSEEWARDGSVAADEHLLDRWCSGLVMLDREAEAFALASRWAADRRGGTDDGKDLPWLTAAIRHLIGQGHELWHGRVDEPRAAVAVEVALASWRRASRTHLAQWVLQHHPIRQTAAGRAAPDTIRAALRAEVDALPPEALGTALQLVGTKDEGAVLERVWSRFEAARGPLRAALAAVLQQHGDTALRLRLFRRLLETADGPRATREAAAVLLAALLAEPWTPAHETEAMGLVRRVGPLADDSADEADARRDAQIVALHRFVDYATESRAAAAVQARPDLTTLTRRKLATARTEARLEARRAALTVLAPIEDSVEAALRQYAALDRCWLEVKAGGDRGATWTRAFGILRALSGATGDAERPARDLIAAERAAATLLRLLVDAPEAAREAEFVATCQAAIVAGRDADAWRELLWLAFVAQDRGDALEAALAQWFGAGTQYAAMRWGRELAAIRAERGALAEAIAVLEGVAKVDELSYADWRRLADWATAAGDAAKTAAAQMKAWETLDEWSLASGLRQEASKVSRSGSETPEGIGPEVPVRLAALFRKAQWPANHLWVLQQLWRPTKDFRLLECLPESVMGHTREAVYQVCGNLGGVLEGLQEEATADRLLAAAAARNTGAADADRRALALLTFVVARRMADQSQGAAPHVARALAALQAAAKGEFGEGERAAYAQFLAGQGTLAGPLAIERHRQIVGLLALERTGTWDRLQVAGSLGDAEWADGNRGGAIRTLTAALADFAAPRDGRLPSEADSWLDRLAGWHVAEGAYVAAEKLWLDVMAQPWEAGRMAGYRQRWFRLQVDALRAGARTSLGDGSAIWAPLRDRLREAPDAAPDEWQAAHLVDLFADAAVVAAKERGVRGAAGDLRDYAWTQLPRTLSRWQHRGGQRMVRAVAHGLERTSGPLLALEFLTVRAENEPRWLRLRNEDFWAQMGWQYAEYRAKVGTPPATLAARVLAIAIRELSDDLRTGESHHRAMFDRHYNHFWADRAGDFARAARAVAEKQPDVEAIVLRGAQYLADGLDRTSEAVDVLSGLHRAGKLSLRARLILAGYLEHLQRWAEVLAIVERGAVEEPGNVHWWAAWLRASAGLGNRAAVAAVHLQAVAALKKAEQWHESAIATLAVACVVAQHLEPAVALFGEAITLHTRGRADRGIGDGTLAEYYRQQAEAFAGLGRTAEAVDAAAGAIVVWGGDRNARAAAISKLEEVLARAADLAAYLVTLDRETEKSGLENPILRRAAGKVLLGQGQFAAAAAQLAKAVEAAPNDLEAGQALVEAYDRMGKPELALGQALALAEARAQDPVGWKALGERYASAAGAAEAERAWTSMVEHLPNESEGHAALAQIRRGQRDLGAAVHHWRQVIRVRTKEPTGYLECARDLIALGQGAEAREMVKVLESTKWPEHFGDLSGPIAELRRALDR